MKQALKIIFVSALATAALIKGVPALAETPPVNVSVVRTVDLDLATPKGRAALEHRLVTAAHAVCDGASAVDLRAVNEQAHCRADVLAAARDRAQAIASRNSGEVIRIAAAR